AWFADAIDAAKLPDDCVLHGLRKTAARRLAEAGCSAHEITCVTGHTTTRMVEHYTKAADRKRGASAAILKLEKNAQLNSKWETVGNREAPNQKAEQNHGAPYGSRTRLFRLKI